MSTYNGQKYIKEQIESLLNQSVVGSDFEVKLIIRDDGSSDNTLDIISTYSDRLFVKIEKGRNFGPARSFWELLNTAPKADYYAFCDQDDVWFPQKLERAIVTLKKHNNQKAALLYCSSVLWTDQFLSPLDYKSNAEPFNDFPHLLLYSISPGCTFVFNNEARDLATKYSFETNQPEIHDWLLLKITSMLGQVYYDSSPSMYYRQHNYNAIGRKNYGFHGLIKRLKNNIGNNSGIRSKIAKSLLNTYKAELASHPKEKYYLDLVANYKESVKKRVLFLREKKFRRALSDSITLIVLILLGKV